MSSGAIEKLLTLASDPISSGPALVSVQGTKAGAKIVAEWLKLLDRRNGFYCFENALHVFATRSGAGTLSLSEWNETDRWRQEYKELDRGGLFVAEDVFGDQFCILAESIYSFDSETGEMTAFADSVEQFAERVMDEFETVTGFPIAHLWQIAHGALPAGQRLVPKTPFVLGGAFEIDNLYPCEASSGMRARGNLATQIASVPDGGKVNYRVLT
jgi:hypothetical protein